MKMKNVEDFYPLTPMQQGMLFHTLYAPDSGVYFEQLRCILSGDFNVSAFERAWNTVVNRHSILRTGFVGEGLKEPVQVVYHEINLPFEKQDWRNLSSTEQEERLNLYLQNDIRQSFQLSKAPLMRFALFQLSDNSYQFIWDYHHILMDGWCVPILLTEVLTYYDSFCNGQDVQLPRSRPYRDYIVWLKKQNYDNAKAYWQRMLKGFTAPTPINIGPVDNKNEDREKEFGDQEIYLPEQLTNMLRDHARTYQLTLNTIIQGSWALLLSRYSGEDDVVFGSTVSGRPTDLAGAESIIGLFINTLPVRAQLYPKTSFLSYLKELQEQQLEQRQFEYSSLIDIQGWSDVPRGLPLFESILVFENYPIETALQEQNERSLIIQNIQSEELTNYPITVVAGPGTELMIKILYDYDRFDDAVIKGMLGHFRKILEEFIKNPQQQIKDLNVLTDDEQKQLLIDWNETKADYPHDRCIHELFEAKVEQIPDATAIIFEEKQLTYRELNQHANQLASYLQKLEVGPEVLVAICIERSVEMIVSILGILKAGGAYLPIDPDYPEERLLFILQDSEASVLITQKDFMQKFSKSNAHIICIDEDWVTISCESREALMSNVTSENLAYMIYTSGSTGKPKGTLLQHQGLSNYIIATINALGVDKYDHVLQFASLSFDASVLEIFTALTSGATLYLARRETLMSSPNLIQFLRKHKITVSLLPPSLLSVLPVEGLPDFKTLLTGGEKCTKDIVLRWYSGRNFYNAYGPTEATVAPTLYHVENVSETLVNIPIGHPLSNIQIYLFDRNLQPVPLGVPGELHIGGVCLARGYHNRPELTAEKFIPNPFSDERGGRLYKTGDLARYLEDGNIEFIGRIDHQVKIRGFRIELGEIENMMLQHPMIQNAVVVVKEYGQQDKNLIAYYVNTKDQTLSSSDLRSFLQKELPDYMIPSAFVQLNVLPLNSSGKIDRKALPEPEGKRPELKKSYVAPRDIWEIELAQIWEDILNIQPIGVKDNFFELGGHSLLAVRMISQIQEKIGKNISLAALFQEPTIEQLAMLIRSEDTTKSTPVLMPLQPKGTKKPLYFIHPSGGSVHWYTDLARYIGKDQPFYGVQAKGLNGEEPIHTKIEDMAAYYVCAIREFQPEGPYFLGSWSLGVIIVFEVAQQLRSQGQEVAFLGLLDQGPVIPSEEPEDNAAYLVQTFGKNLSLSLEQLRKLNDDEQIEYVFKLAKQVNWLLPDVKLHQFRHFILMLRTHTDAWRNYRPKVYPGNITVFRAEEQTNKNIDQKDLGWGDLTTEKVEIHEVPGDHLSMVHKPHVKKLAKRLKACLDNIQAQ